MDHGHRGTGTYVDRILEVFDEHGDRDAVVMGEQRISYPDARVTVLRLAEELRARGLRKGDTVALFTGNRPEAVLVQLAVHLIGCWLVFVPPEPALAEQVAFIRRAKVSGFIFDPRDERGSGLARLAEPRVVLTLGPADIGADLLALAGKRSGELPGDRAVKADVATVFYTGGTTGRPKMVLHRHAYYDGLMLAGERRRAESPVPQRFLVCTTVNHSSGHLATIMTLLAGGTAVLADGFDAGKIIATLLSERITSTVFVPPGLGEILDHPALPADGFPDLVRLHYGGAPTSTARIRQAIERFGPVLRQTYGLTEIPVITILEPADHDLSVPGRLTACGKPLPGLSERSEISLREDGREVEPGAIGEVCIRGPLVMSEYWNDPELTAKAMHDGWLHTGDLGQFDDEGFLHLVDRIRDMIITGMTSANVYSAMLEEVLMKQPGVRLAAVVGLPHETFGESVHAVCVVDATIPVDPAELGKRVVEELGEFYEPQTIRFVDSLPRTAIGKIDKKAVRKLLTEGAPR